MNYWWLFFTLFLILGFAGCVGSFMNAVIYRLPRSVPLTRPLWSFCPACRRSIKWYDNIPVFSYFRLRARCRYCSAPIAPRYVVIEVITILMFLLLFDAFFVAHLRNGIVSSTFSIGYQLYEDWPIYLAHGLLFACLIGMSAIDIEAYWVDIRFTHFAAGCGFVLHAIWTPARQPSWPRPDSAVAAAALLATVGAIIVHLAATWYWTRRLRAEEASQSGPAAASQEPPGSPPRADQPANEVRLPAAADAQQAGAGRAPASPRTFPFSALLAGLVLYFTLALLLVTAVQQTSAHPSTTLPPFSAEPQSFNPPDTDYALRVVPALAFVFLAMLASGIVQRPADQEIEEALEAERHSARRVALVELSCMLLPVALFIATFLLVRSGGMLEEPWQHLWHWRLGRQQPMLGLGTAALGFIVAAAIGWAVRIGFTLLLGKEAFGAGDIHIMAAAGAVTGWEVVAVGFLLSALLALVGWILTLPFKRGHALPMGPWLTLAIFIVVLMREPVISGYLGPSFSLMLKHWFGVTI